MCGPFVISQVTNRMQNIAIENYGNFEKLKNLALFPYHFGRIITYSFLGLISGFLSQKINDFRFFKYFAAFLMLVGAVTFLNYFFDGKISKFLQQKFSKKRLFKLPKNLNKKLFFMTKIQKFITFLFKNPKGFKGFLLGIILGFIPCGMIYSAIALSLTFQSAILSMFGMMLFGLATFPALFSTACGSYFFIKKINFWLISKLIILINFNFLSLLAFKLIFL